MNDGNCQLRSIVERIEELLEEEKDKDAFGRRDRPPVAVPDDYVAGPRLLRNRPPPKGAGVSVEYAAPWLDLVSRLVVAANHNEDEAGTRRAFMIACKLLGLPWIHIETAVSQASFCGGQRAAAGWAPQMFPAHLPFVGYVYVAESTLDPSRIKVGFSRTPEKRVKSLSRGGDKLSLLIAHPGTLLHEWALHQRLFRLAVNPEWYARDTLPPWLFEPLANDMPKVAA